MKKTIGIVVVFVLLVHSNYAQTLSDYLLEAAKNNPGLKARYKDFEVALEKIPQVSSLPDPTFSFGYFISPVETRVGPQQARFSLSQMFPWFGTLKAQENVAALMAEAKYQAFLDERNRLYYKVSAAYYPLYELNQWKKIEEENIRILQSYKTIAQKKFENGNGTMVDVLRVDIILKEAQTTLSILEEKQKPLLSTFNNLLNRGDSTEVTIKDSLIVDALPYDYRRDSLLVNNPALEELNLKMKASEASENVAHKQGLPKLGVGLDYVLIGPRSDLPAGQAGMDIPDNGKNALMPMVSLSIPVYRKKYKAAVKEAQLEQEKFALQKEDYVNSLTSGYEMGLFEIQQQYQLLKLYDAQVNESNQALNLLFSAYGNSGKDFEEVLRMQQQLLRYEKMKATAKAQYHTAIARLNYLTAKSY